MKEKSTLLSRRTDASVNLQVPVFNNNDNHHQINNNNNINNSNNYSNLDLFSSTILPSPFKPAPSPFRTTFSSYFPGAPSPTVGNIFSPRQFLYAEAHGPEFVDRLASLPSPSNLNLFSSPSQAKITSRDHHNNQMDDENNNNLNNTSTGNLDSFPFHNLSFPPELDSLDQLAAPSPSGLSFSFPSPHAAQALGSREGAKRKGDAFPRDSSFGLRTNSDLQRQAVQKLFGEEESEQNSQSQSSSLRIDQLLSPFKKTCLSPISPEYLSDIGDQVTSAHKASRQGHRNTESDVVPPAKAGFLSVTDSVQPEEARLNRDRRMRIRAMKAIKRSIKLDRNQISGSGKAPVNLANDSSGSVSFGKTSNKSNVLSRRDSKKKQEDEAALSERLLRNREAAFKSRQAAKDKMIVLQKEHGQLQSTVGNLKNENMTLRSQIEALTKKVALLSSFKHMTSATVHGTHGGQSRRFSPRVTTGANPPILAKLTNKLSPRSATKPGSQAHMSPKAELPNY